MSIDLGSAFGRIILEAQDALDQTGKVGKALGGLAGPAGMMAAGIATAGAAAGGALIALGASSVGVAREFESSMAIMSTAVDPVSVGAQTTAEAMGILGDASLAVGSDTSLVGVSASTAAEAMTGLYKAGLSTGEIFGDLQGYMAGTSELSGALRASIDLAAASELDMVQASDLAAVTLATFGGHLETEAERAEFINSAMNNFVQTADASQASVTDLAAALGNIGPTAAAFGFGLEDVNVALGILSDRGITGSEAGTALKSMMTNMMRDTPAVTGALKELGISLYDVDGNMRPLPDIISQFDSALNGTREVMVTVGGRTEEQNRQLELAMNAYDQATEAIYKHESGLKVLSEDGLAKVQAQQAAANGEIERLQSIVGDTTVSLQDMTQEQRNQYIQTIAGTYGMNALNSLLAEGAIGWEEMEAAIGDAATMQETAAARTATLDGAMEALGGVAETFRIKVGTALIPVLTSLAGIGATLLEKYGPTLTAVFENVGNGIQRIVEVIQNGQLGELFTVFEDGSSVLGGIFESFGMGEQQAANLATGISNVVTAVENFITPIAEFVQNHGPLLLQILGGLTVAFGAFTIITTVVGWIGGLIGAISGIGAAITAAGGGITGLIAILGGPLTLVIGAIAAAIALFAMAWKSDWGGIQGKVQEVIAFLQPLLQGWLTGLSTWWSATWPQLQAVLQTVWGVIQSVIQSAIAVIGPAIQAFIGGLAPVWEQLKGLWPTLVGMWEAAKPVLLGVLTVVGAALVALVGLASGVITGLSRALGPLIQGIIGAVQGIIRVFTGIFQTLQGLFRLIVGIFTGNTELMQQAWENLKTGVTNIVGGLVDGISSLIGGLVEAVTGFVSGLIEGVIGFFQNLYDRLVGHSIVTDLVERIRSLWEELWALATSVIETAVATIQGVIEAFVELFQGDWEGFKEKIGEVWEEAWDKVVAIAEGLWDRISDWLTGLWTNIRNWFTDMDWPSLGRNIILGIVEGLQAIGSLITDTIMNFMKAAWDSVTDFWEIDSPSDLTFWAGMMIGQGLIDGIRATAEDAVAALDSIFEAMGNVAGLGGGFGGEFKRRVLDPLEAGLDDLNQQIEGYDDSIQGMAEMLGLGDLVGTPGWEQMIQRFIDSPFASDEQRGIARTLMASLRERARLTAEQIEMQRELIRQQERLAAMEEKRAQIGFLQQQLDLIKLITDNGLGLDILQGIELGIGADPGALMDAMAAAMRRMIQAAEDELGIASASKVFKRIAAQAQEGLIVQMADSRGVVRAARGMARNMADSAELALAGVGAGADSAGAMDSSRRLTMYGGQHFYFQQRRGSVLEEVQGLLTP